MKWAITVLLGKRIVEALQVLRGFDELERVLQHLGDLGWELLGLIQGKTEGNSLLVNARVVCINGSRRIEAAKRKD